MATDVQIGGNLTVYFADVAAVDLVPGLLDFLREHGVVHLAVGPARVRCAQVADDVAHADVENAGGADGDGERKGGLEQAFDHHDRQARQLVRAVERPAGRVLHRKTCGAGGSGSARPDTPGGGAAIARQTRIGSDRRFGGEHQMIDRG